MSISPNEYDGKTCDELVIEQMRVWRRAEDLRIPLKRAAEDFPLLAGTNKHAEIESEYSEMLGRLRAVELVAFRDKCKILSSDELKEEYGLDGRVRSSWPSTN
jgi:hypothetical protein